MLTKLPSFNDPSMYVFLWNGEFCGEGHYFCNNGEVIIPWSDDIYRYRPCIIDKNGQVENSRYIKYIYIGVTRVSFIEKYKISTEELILVDHGEIIYIDTNGIMLAKIIFKKNKSDQYLMRIL